MFNKTSAFCELKHQFDELQLSKIYQLISLGWTLFYV